MFLMTACQGVGLSSVAGMHVRLDNEGCVPALQHEDNSNRPFQTVEELAKKLGKYVLHYMHMYISWRLCMTCMFCRHEPEDGQRHRHQRRQHLQ